MFIVSLISVGDLNSFVQASKTAGIRHKSIHLINGHSIGIVPPFLSTTQIKTCPWPFTTVTQWKVMLEGFWSFGLNAYAGHSIKLTGTFYP